MSDICCHYHARTNPSDIRHRCMVRHSIWGEDDTIPISRLQRDETTTGHIIPALEWARYHIP